MSFPQRKQRAPSGPGTPGARGPVLRALSPPKRGPRASTGPPGLSSPHRWCCALDSPAVFFTPDYSVQCQIHTASRWGDTSDVTVPFRTPVRRIPHQTPAAQPTPEFPSVTRPSGSIFSRSAHVCQGPAREERRPCRPRAVPQLTVGLPAQKAVAAQTRGSFRSVYNLPQQVRDAKPFSARGPHGNRWQARLSPRAGVGYELLEGKSLRFHLRTPPVASKIPSWVLSRKSAWYFRKDGDNL